MKGWTLIVMLLAALLVAYLAATQLHKQGVGGGAEEARQENPVAQAQDAVNALNDAMAKRYS